MTYVACVLLPSTSLFWSSLARCLRGPGFPRPRYLVAAGLGARLVHGEPQRGAGRERPALFAVGGHLLRLPVVHHLHSHAL